MNQEEKRVLDERIVGTLRAAVGPQVRLLIDGGMAWSIEQAMDRIRRFAPFDLHWLEEPLAPYDSDAYARVRRASNIPIAAGEMATGGGELRRLIEAGSVDNLQIDISRIGLTEGIRIARLAGARGIQVVNHTYSHILNTAASLQLAAACDNAGLFEHPAGQHEIREALARAQLQPEQGWLGLPTAPGLGISVDEDVLRRFTPDRADRTSRGSPSGAH